MSTRTAIEWTDRTWNPTTDYTRVSPGRYDHCYAEHFCGTKRSGSLRRFVHQRYGAAGAPARF